MAPKKFVEALLLVVGLAESGCGGNDDDPNENPVGVADTSVDFSS